MGSFHHPLSLCGIGQLSPPIPHLTVLQEVVVGIGRPSRAFPPLEPYVHVSAHTARARDRSVFGASVDVPASFRGKFLLPRSFRQTLPGPLSPMRNSVPFRVSSPEPISSITEEPSLLTFSFPRTHLRAFATSLPRRGYDDFHVNP
jgi:hypothetical protein